MAEPGAEAPARVKRRLRNYLLDKGLQLRYVAFVTLLSAVITCTLTYFVWDQSNSATVIVADSINAAEPDFLDDEHKAHAIANLKGGDRLYLFIIAMAGLGLIGVLSAYLIVMTHKVAGPLYKIAGMLDQLKEQKLPRITYIRKGDQFQAFFHKFKRMTDSLNDRAMAEARLYDECLRACEKGAGGSSAEMSHALDELRSLRQRKESFVG